MPSRPSMNSQSTDGLSGEAVEEALERVVLRDAEGEEALGRAAAVDPGRVAEAVEGALLVVAGVEAEGEGLVEERPQEGDAEGDPQGGQGPGEPGASSSWSVVTPALRRSRRW